ncbi:MAG: TIGR03986 family CRISPR-associated RAMP protein, partial [Victivallales bacterium]|nr:TIGR03986 family CRISPR-associated RAMP protein [Victivallales bacterium]
MGSDNNVSDIHGPYHFVPLSDTVVIPDWGEMVSQDIPFSDHEDGELDITIEAMSPIFIREGSEEKRRDNQLVQDFFHDASGRYCIPGTSLKGMMRNVLEIASFGKMQHIANKRYAVRDLNSEMYRGKFTVGWDSVVKAGWLDISDYDNWRIFPCKYAEWDRPGEAGNLGLGRDFGNKRQSAADKYLAFMEKKGSLKQTADVEDVPLNKAEKIPAHREAHFPGKQVKGWLVFTGQPQDYVAGRKGLKYHEFFFYGDDSESVECDGEDNLFGGRRKFFFVDTPQTEDDEREESVRHANRDDFLFCHDANQKQTNAQDWLNWLDGKRLKRIREENFAGMIPVFYVGYQHKTDRAKLRFGLTKMFRFAGERSVGEAARNSSCLHFPMKKEEFQPDLADLMFGYAKPWGALRGRVQFGTAMAEGEVTPEPSETLVLGTPRPSFYPAYLQQPGGNSGQIDKKNYKTWLHRDAKLRGWKRYPVLNDNKFQRTETEEQNRNMDITFRPLPSGTKFHAKVRYHNLRKIELGALIWCLQFKNDKYYWHSLGMAKPYGFGKVKVTIDGPLSEEKLKEYCRCFVQYMTLKLSELGVGVPFEKTPQILALLDLAYNEEMKTTDWVFKYMSRDDY